MAMPAEHTADHNLSMRLLVRQKFGGTFDQIVQANDTNLLEDMTFKLFASELMDNIKRVAHIVMVFSVVALIICIPVAVVLSGHQPPSDDYLNELYPGSYLPMRRNPNETTTEGPLNPAFSVIYISCALVVLGVTSLAVFCSLPRYSHESIKKARRIVNDTLVDRFKGVDERIRAENTDQELIAASQKMQGIESLSAEEREEIYADVLQELFGRISFTFERAKTAKGVHFSRAVIVVGSSFEV